jgi:hypothetical protein
MASKKDFTPEEWTKVLNSPVVVGIAVSAADPSGLWGTLKEAVASSSAVVASKLDPGSNELVKAVVADFETPQGRSDIQNALRKHFTGAHPTDCVQRSLDTLRQVAFMGFGGVRVSDAEKATLADITKALGATA